MLIYKLYYNISPSYLCELINKKESHVNTRLVTDHLQLIRLPIGKDCSNTFLQRSFIYAPPCEWNKLSEHIRTSNVDCCKKSIVRCMIVRMLHSVTHSVRLLNMNICLCIY